MRKNSLSLESKIGHTPVVRLKRIEKMFGFQNHIYAKLEGQNPSGSTKDRAALYMLKDGVKRGVIKDGTWVVEPTSGNLGISLAMLSSSFGYNARIVMPSSLSSERSSLISAYGGEIVYVNGGMSEARDCVAEIIKNTKNSVTLSQFTNKNNTRAHNLTTGPEIFYQMRGAIDVFVAGVGSGGSISGTGGYLKRRNSFVRLIAVQPSSSQNLTGGKVGSHGIFGIGADFLPPLFDSAMVDEVVSVSDFEAVQMTRMISKAEGILVGVSSGATLSAAYKIDSKIGEGRNVVILFADRGERYLSTGLFDE